MILRTILSLIATAATAVQSWFIFKDGKGFCFNDGCNIVKHLTTVPSLYFYIFASVFFLIIFIFSVVSLIKGREKNSSVEVWIHFFLTAAFAAEGVLIFFQYRIVYTFCSVCLIVFFMIVLLNITSGIWQFLRAGVIFSSVLMACFSLQFEGSIGNRNSKETGSVQNIKNGTIAIYKEEGNRENVLLIFSESCPHCEEIIDFLQEESFCNVSFNPYEKMTQLFQFEGAVINQNYNYTATRSFMKSLGFNSLPLLIAGDNTRGIEILQGSLAIKRYLQKHCRLPEDMKKRDLSSGQSKIPAKDGFIESPSTSDTCNDDSPCM